jgi:signal transduction histidine kinase
LKILIQSNWDPSSLSSSKQIKEHEKVITYLNGIIDKSRALAMRLRPSTLDALGLSTALKTMFHEIKRSRAVKIIFRHDPIDDLKFQAEPVNIFRIVQEAMTNILKHAKASSIKISMRMHNNELKIVIEDNGCGFLDKQNQAGLGLVTMKERVLLLGGRIELRSELKKGTIIKIVIPVKGSL